MKIIRMIADVSLLLWIADSNCPISQFWIVHHGKVDVPAMYYPDGRYKYWNGIVRENLGRER